MEPNTEMTPRPLDERLAETDKRIQQCMALTAAYTQAVAKAPVIQAAREDAVLVRYAALATRVRGLEEQHSELCNVVIEVFDLLRELREIERFIGTIRRECLDHVIVFSERSLHHHLHSSVGYYHQTRTPRTAEG